MHILPHAAEMTDSLRCRPSTNGSADIYFEPPWAQTRYIAYVSWELRPLTKEEHDQAWIDLEKRRRPEAQEEANEEEGGDSDGGDDQSEENKESVAYLVVVLDSVSNHPLVVLPVIGVLTLGILLGKLWWRLRSVKEGKDTQDSKGGSNGSKTRGKQSKVVKKK